MGRHKHGFYQKPTKVQQLQYAFGSAESTYQVAPFPPLEASLHGRGCCRNFQQGYNAVYMVLQEALSETGTGSHPLILFGIFRAIGHLSEHELCLPSTNR